MILKHLYDKIQLERRYNMSIDPAWIKLEWIAVQDQASVDQHAQETQRAQNKAEEEARNGS